ncbi:MAG: M12 family metallo-peptidase [Ferruginibacter sp.]
MVDLLHSNTLRSALLRIFLILFTGTVNAQSPVQLFNNENSLPAALKNYVDQGSVYELNQAAIDQLFVEKPKSLTVQFHFENKDWVIDLEANDVFSKGFFVKNAAGKNIDYDKNEALHYKGKIKGNSKAFVAISILRKEIIGVLADENGNINIGELSGGHSSNKQHIIFREHDLKTIQPFECGALPDNNPLPQLNAIASTSAAVNTESVDMYFEADYKCYQNNGSNISNTVNWATALFNVVTTLYDNDSVFVRMSGIKVWNVADPYVALTTTADILYAFSSNMNTAGIPGDLAHLMSQRSLGGGIAWINTLCSSAYNRCAVSGNLSNAFSQLPTYSWSTMVITHETGHNIGSNHTQWCGWPGGAIDNCYSTEGGCAQGPAPVNGGTIMSYCHLTSYGINLMNGFGPLPGAVIRNAVRTSTCIYPRISFSTGFQTVTEEDADSANGCLPYKLVTTKLALNYTPLQPAIISLLPTAVASPGLIIGTDKDVSISPMNFTLSDTTPQVIQLKIYNDAIIENKETLKLDYSIAANGTNAIKNGTYQLDILSLDHRPDSSVNQLLYFEPFDSIASGLGTWTQTVVYGNASPNRWMIGNSGDAQFSGKAAYISSNGSTATYAGASVTDSAVVRFESPLINANGFSNMHLTYLYKCNGEGGGVQGSGGGTPLDYTKVYYSVNSGTTWSVLRESIYSRSAKLTEDIILPAAANNSSTLKIAFEWYNNSSVVNNPPMIIDSLLIKGTSNCPVQSAANVANVDEEYLGPNQTVYYYNPVTKNIMAVIVNKSSHDFGCTKLEIIRTGISAAAAWGIYPSQKIADKAYKITTANTDTISPYDISLYYTADEINGWVNATGNSSNDIAVVKTAGDITQVPPISAPQFSNYNTTANFGGTDKVVTATFTGTGTFSIARPGITIICPGNTQQLSANENGLSYQWQLNTGAGYINISDNSFYSGATAANISIINAPTSWYGYKYRCIINDAQGQYYSIEYVLKFAVNWTGTSGTAWEDAANWSCGKLPDANTDVFINNGAASYPLVNLSAAVRSLKIQNGAAVTIKNGTVLQIIQ